MFQAWKVPGQRAASKLPVGDRVHNSQNFPSLVSEDPTTLEIVRCNSLEMFVAKRERGQTDNPARIVLGSSLFVKRPYQVGRMFGGLGS